MATRYVAILEIAVSLKKEDQYDKMQSKRNVAKRGLYWLTSIATACFLGACSSTHFEVSRYDAQKAKQSNTCVYYLPQTVIDFDFAVVRSHYTPGPYAPYSEKFLGITTVSTTPAQHCQITKVRASTHQEEDVRYPFLATLRCQAPSSILFGQLTANGLLLPANATPHVTPYASQQQCSTQQQYCYTDLSSYPFIDSEQSVFQSVVQKDSTFVNVPVTREVTVKRSVEEKARQAADQIFALRKRRIELLLGDDMPTTNDGIPTVLKEIARLEAEYLSLFIGHTAYDTLHVQRSYTPNWTDNSAILCRFSDTQGIVSANDMTASPILLQLTCDVKEMIELESLSTLHNAYYYRTAMPTLVQLSLNSGTIYQGRVAISQYGKLMHAPVQLRLNHNNQ